MRRFAISLVLVVVVVAMGSGLVDRARGADDVGRSIVVAGQKFDIGTPVVLWSDPGGYDAYKTTPRFAATKTGPPDGKLRYGSRTSRLDPADAARVEKDGWDLPTLRSVVDQFVLHYDVCGTSKRCFQVLQDDRGLSVHFLLDLDGTIYQTLDLQESAWHATKSNGRSVGIEIAHMGAYPPGRPGRSEAWYTRGPDGKVTISIQDPLGKGSQRRGDLVLAPARPEPIEGKIRGAELRQWDFTPQQYEALTKLVAGVSRALPKVRCDYPRDASGKLRLDTLSDDEWKSYQGVMGHYHIQTNKTDPGPALDWDRIIEGAKAILKANPSKAAD
jgi:N-acetyl-anhydromuramyl-L-alanine amidase AmpD